MLFSTYIPNDPIVFPNGYDTEVEVDFADSTITIWSIAEGTRGDEGSTGISLSAAEVEDLIEALRGAVDLLEAV